MKQKSTLYLVDASIYIFRAYFSLPDTMVGKNGQPVHAVYGYATFLTQLLQRSRATHMAVAFDESLNTSFRNELYPAYKANRELPPAELEAQLKHCQQLTQAMGIASFVSPRYEADDLIGTVAHKLRPKGFKMVYVSSDKDLAQLVQTGDVLWDFARDEKLRPQHIRQRFGVKPSQMVDLLALKGDGVDNIPGVPGIGEKSATLLLQRFGSLDRLYESLDKITQLPLRGAARIQKLLAQHREQAYLCQRLACIVHNAPIRCPVTSLARKRYQAAQLDTLYDQLNFGNGIRTRLEQAVRYRD